MHTILIDAAFSLRDAASAWRRSVRGLCKLAAIVVGLISTLVYAVPQVAISSLEHDFGVQQLDTRSAPFNGYITNAGTGRMTLEAFSVDGCCIAGRGSGEWAMAGTCRKGLQLDTGESCSFAVTFQPNRLGSHLGSVLLYVPEASYFLGSSNPTLRGTGVAVQPYAYFWLGALPETFENVLGFGRTDIGPPGATQLMSVQNLGLADLQITSWEIVGPNAVEFALGDGCRPGSVVAPLAICQLEIRFTPVATGWRTASVFLSSNGNPPLTGAKLVGTTTGPIVTEYATFGAPRFGSTVYSRTVLGNDSRQPFKVTSVSLAGASNITIDSDACNGATVAPGATCTIEYAYTRAESDLGNEPVRATTTIMTTAGEFIDAASAFVGVSSPEEAFVRLFEFYHASTGHYFIASTNQLAEIRDLDTGVHPGWARTGKSFYAYAMSGWERLPVCRFYIPPGYGDSHFYSASPAECEETHTKFPHLIYESVDLFGFRLPDATTGACDAKAIPVYRLWNNRPDSNHRYTTDTRVVDQMTAQGWIAEGYGAGPYRPVMCGPTSMATPTTG